MEAAAGFRVSRPPTHLVLGRCNPASQSRLLSFREPVSWTYKRFRVSHPNTGITCALDNAYDGETLGHTSVFPRINVRDPYKRLGVSRDSSEEEIQEARNFLAEQYVGHERSRESIEAAHDKIIMESFRARKKSKINLKSNLKKKVADSPPWVRNFLSFFETPSSQVILQRAVFFALMGVWSVMNPAEGGPAFQVAVSLAGCIYLLNYRLKSVGRSFILGFGGLVVGWVFGSFLLPVLPTALLPASWSLELLTALISYVFMWFSCTFLK